MKFQLLKDTEHYLFYIYFFVLFLCVSVFCLDVCLYTTSMPDALAGLRKASYPLELE